MKLDFTLKEGLEPIYSSEPYYDLFEGGYIEPLDILEDKDTASAINDAVVLINQFLANIEPEDGWE